MDTAPIIAELGVTVLEIYKEIDYCMVSKVLYEGDVHILKISTLDISSQIEILKRVNDVIPSPRIIKSGTHAGTSYVIMTYADGVCMEDYKGDLGPGVMSDLYDYVRLMHSIVEMPKDENAVTHDMYATVAAGKNASH
ncbi:hypothetical protein DSL72_005984 [Monilinia vaccinii-corymbosi]|uniref:Aminoglycoside phosphotransferase domain-containing protein n=1 Tax=Monilinia vaccinii-corymbosi TaxID=61207 RepID=A0A8A3PGI9_9HELO|nr:hypothetical protein DSL72_005984 [Monilinia vaccinii-corymbosi]